jgi:hypothetical protein
MMFAWCFIAMGEKGLIGLPRRLFAGDRRMSLYNITMHNSSSTFHEMNHSTLHLFFFTCERNSLY